MTGRILYGYRMEKGIAVVEQTEGVYVQKLFDDYINGIPQYKLLPELIQYTEKNQLPLPTIKASYMKTLLTNPKYVGDRLYPQLKMCIRDRYRIIQDRLYQSDFDRLVSDTEKEE